MSLKLGPRARRIPALVAVAGLMLAGCASASPAAAPPQALRPLPLAVSLTTDTATWAVVPVHGFWELLRVPAKGSRWSNVTPPGVGDSGGLVVGIASDEALMAGFLPSDLLKFSPVERTDNGSAWTPGLLPGALAHGPDVLAAGGGGSAWAVLAPDRGKVVATSGGGADWHPLVDESQLAGTVAGRACGVTEVTAVADVGAAAGGLLGVSYARPGVVGILRRPAGAGNGDWTLSGPRLPAALAGGRVHVLRLVGGPDGRFVLLAVTTAGSNHADDEHVLAAWSGAGDGSWHESAPLALGAGSPAGEIVSAGPIGTAPRAPGTTTTPAAPGATASVLIRRPDGSLATEQASATTATWRLVASTPARTVALAQAAGGPLEALAVQGQFVQIWSHDPASAYWRKIQTIFVPPGAS